MSSITLKPEINKLYTLTQFISNELPQVNFITEETFVNIVNYSKSEFITVNAESHINYGIY